MAIPQHTFEAAQQGDPAAIAKLINHALQPKGIAARVTRKDNCLRVMLEADQLPNQTELVPYLKKNLEKLGAALVDGVEVQAKQTCASVPAWRQYFDLAPQPVSVSESLQVQATANSLNAPKPLEAVSPGPTVDSRSLITRSPAKPQRPYQGVFSVIIALILILLGANLKSAQVLLAKAQNQKKISLSKTKDGAYQAEIINRVGGVPVILVTFNGNQSYPMVVDTGAAGTLITPPMASTLGVTPAGKVNVQTANGYTSLDIGYVNSIEVDGAKISRVPVAIGLPDMPYGLLGHDFFGTFDVTVREKVVEFRPREES